MIGIITGLITLAIFVFIIGKILRFFARCLRG